MRMLKWVIAGEVLLVLLKFHPHQELFSKDEKRIYSELRRCAIILLKDSERDDGKSKGSITTKLVKLCRTTIT